MKRTAIALALAATICSLTGCGASYTLGAKLTLGARKVGDAVAAGMTEQTRLVTVMCTTRCEQASILDKACYKDCIAPWKVHRERFRVYGVPSINTTVRAGKLGVELAKAAGDKEAAKAMGLKALCGVAKLVEPWLPKIPAKWQDVAKLALGAVKGMVCK